MIKGGSERKDLKVGDSEGSNLGVFLTLLIPQRRGNEGCTSAYVERGWIGAASQKPRSRRDKRRESIVPPTVGGSPLKVEGGRDETEGAAKEIGFKRVNFLSPLNLRRMRGIGKGNPILENFDQDGKGGMVFSNSRGESVKVAFSRGPSRSGTSKMANGRSSTRKSISLFPRE